MQICRAYTGRQRLRAGHRYSSRFWALHAMRPKENPVVCRHPLRNACRGRDLRQSFCKTLLSTSFVPIVSIRCEVASAMPTMLERWSIRGLLDRTASTGDRAGKSESSSSGAGDTTATVSASCCTIVPLTGPVINSRTAVLGTLHDTGVISSAIASNKMVYLLMFLVAAGHKWHDMRLLLCGRPECPRQAPRRDRCICGAAQQLCRGEKPNLCAQACFSEPLA